MGCRERHRLTYLSRPAPIEDAPSRTEGGFVDHVPGTVDADASAGELDELQKRLGALDFVAGRGEHLVYHPHLRGMDRLSGAEACTLEVRGASTKSLTVSHRRAHGSARCSRA